MSDAHGITKENLLFTFPSALRENPSIAALGDVTMEALAKRPVEISRLSIYPRIGELPEALLDILARDFKVDWWDPNYSLEEKRRVFKDSWYVHKHMGTKAAVVTAVSAIYPETKVEEWFEYGGRPYGFKIYLNMTGEKWDEERPRRILEKVQFYKSLRSHLDGMEFTTVLPPATLHVGGAFGALARIGVPEDTAPPERPVRLWVGGVFGSLENFGVPEDTVLPERPERLRAGGVFASREALPIPEDASPADAISILRTGGICTIISNRIKEE